MDTFEAGLTGTLNTQSLAINAAGIQSTFFINEGESVGALEIGAQLPNSERLTFFLQEAKTGQINLTQTFPAVMAANSEGLRLSHEDENTKDKKILAIPPSYVKYLTSTQTYFALSGTLNVGIQGKNLTLTWNINFKDKDGNTFTSNGTVKVKDYDSNKKPKSEINSPTSNLSITSLSTDYAKSGDEVTISGTGFSALKSENTVTLGTVTVTILESTATSLKVTVPADAVHGKFKVTLLGSSVESADFFFIPIITDLDKNTVKIGETVTIQGNHFDTDKSKLEVKLGDKTLSITESGYSSITVVIPEGATSGKVTVTRIGKDPVEGPELTIEAVVPEPELMGPPVNEIFEVRSGSLDFAEIFTNNTEYGSVWHMFMDQRNNYLYAVTEKHLLQINLDTRTVKEVAGPNSLIFKRDIAGLPSVNTTPPAFFAAPDGMIYGYRSSFAALLSPTNVFKLNPNTGEVTPLGSVKVDSGASMASLFVDNTGNLYFNEFTSSYRVSSYDANMSNRKDLITAITGDLVAGFIPTSENSFRVARGLLISNNNDYKYHDVVSNEGGAVNNWGGNLQSLRPSIGHSTPLMIGIGFTQGDFYGFSTSITEVDSRAYANYPKLRYSLGIQEGGQGNFVKKGEFEIIQEFQFGNEPRFLRAYPQSSYRNAFAVDAQGNAYILLTSPLNPSTGTEIVKGLGGIYRVSF